MSRACEAYWNKKKLKFSDQTYDKIIKGSTKYLYGSTSFGRFYDKAPKDLASLPNSFKQSRECDKWSQEFWDIVRPDRVGVVK